MYLNPHVAVKYAMECFRSRNKQSCTPLAVVNAEYVSHNRSWARKVIRQAKVLRNQDRLGGVK